MSHADERLSAAAAAAGDGTADLVLRGGAYVEVYTGQILHGDVAIIGTRIAAVGQVDHCLGTDTEVLDFSGLILLPGLIEPHIHIGGSQLTIERLAEVLVPNGTAAICTDFYEPGVISGRVAIEELISRSDGTGLDILLSPFHATALGFGPFGNTDRFGLEDLIHLAQHPSAVAIREWNFASSQIPLAEIRRFYEVALERRLAVEGHLEGLTGPALQASVALGVMTDHETGTADQAIEMARLGITVQIREGSGARDMAKVVRAITEKGGDPRNFSLATDEQELHSLARDGHMNYKLRLAVAHGVSPIAAVRMATLTAAEGLGVARDYGSIAPGRIASIAAVRDLRDFEVELVVSRGRVSARKGEYLLETREVPYPTEWYETVHVHHRLEARDFAFDPSIDRAQVRIIGITPGSLVTEELVDDVTFNDGIPDRTTGLATLAVIDRHEGGSRKGLGLLRGFNLSAGAVATTINPGLMNLLVLGVDEDDMAAAANRVIELQGGIVVVRDGQVRGEVSTPVFGILSDKPSAEVIESCRAVADAIASDLGIEFNGLVTSVGFACLAVIIPALKLCDRGLVRITRDGGQEAVDLVVAGG
jgi:adenine deaminase